MPAANCGSLSDMILLGRPCNFHMLSLNNLTSPSTIILSVVGIKCTILANQSTTTRIESYLCTNSNLVMKSAEMCVQGLSGIELGINLPAGCSVWFLFHWQTSHPSIYHFLSLVIPGHQKFLVTSSTVFHCLPCSLAGILWCSLIISALSFSFFGTYTFLSLYIIPFSSLYSSSLNTFTPACFIFSTAFITSSSLTFDTLTFSNRSTPFIITSTVSVLLTFSYSGFTSTSFSLSLFTSTSQSGLLLRLFAFPILLSGICFNMKSNLDRYSAYPACLWFSFCTFIKYSRFLWSVQISNFVVVPSRKCLHASRPLTTASISLLYIS